MKDKKNFWKLGGLLIQLSFLFFFLQSKIPTDFPLQPSKKPKKPKVKVFFGEQRRLHKLKEQARKAADLIISDQEEDESKGQELGWATTDSDYFTETSNNPNFKTLTATRSRRKAKKKVVLDV